MILHTADGTKLFGILNQAKEKNDKIVILCHGITADKDEEGIFVELSSALTSQGIDCFRFDFRGHGESKETQEDITIAGELVDLETVFEWVKRGYKRIGLLGASFGGGVASLFASFNQKYVHGLVLWNPSLDFTQYLVPKTEWKKKYFGEEAFQRALNLGYTQIGNSRFKFGIKIFNEVRFIKPYEALKKFPGPILFVHGDKDTYVPYEDSIKYSRLVGGKLTTIKGGQHGFQDDKRGREEVIKATVDFFNRSFYK
ncbi:alpha/beta fold hydrolase [Candidatus Roizmanbacteria bacterium]|nr:alpha/beta fold hydrolase [Candidatus Roizmanbacteria bacterium]